MSSLPFFRPGRGEETEVSSVKSFPVLLVFVAPLVRC